MIDDVANFVRSIIRYDMYIYFFVITMRLSHFATIFLHKSQIPFSILSLITESVVNGLKEVSSVGFLIKMICKSFWMQLVLGIIQFVGAPPVDQKIITGVDFSSEKLVNKFATLIFLLCICNIYFIQFDEI